MATKRCPQCKGAGWVFLSSEYDERAGVYTGGTTLCGHCEGAGRVVMETKHNAKPVMESKPYCSFCGADIPEGRGTDDCAGGLWCPGCPPF
jgi:hypothetical protein